MRPFDRFVLLNLILFLLMAGTVYFDRFNQYRGPGNRVEFFFYGAFVIGLILIAWRSLRQISFPLILLVMVEGGILMHFAGGLLVIDGQRLYDHFILGIRYDKFVHFANAFVAAAAIDTIFAKRHLRLSVLRPLVLLLIVLGAGACIEIIEYLVTLTVTHNGVGGYDNNMQDLIGNLVGATAFIFWRNLAPHALPEIGGRG